MRRSYKTLGYISAGLFLAFGRYPISWLLSSKRKAVKPVKLHSSEHLYINCPSGNRIYAEFDGHADKQAIVFLHGLNSSSLQWYYQRLFFKNNYRLIFIDLPGHGRSSRPANLSIAAIASDLKAVLSKLSVNKPILFGHSMGAMAVMEYCSKNSEAAVKGIILQHSTYSNPLKTISLSWLMRQLQEPVLKPFFNFAIRHPLLFSVLGRVNYLNGLSLIFYRYLFYTGKQTAAQLRFTSKIAALCPPEVVAQGLLKCMEFNVSDVLKKIKIPALVIIGKNDRITKPRAGRYIANHIKDALAVQVNSGHLSLMEIPDDVNDVAGRFITGLVFRAI